MQTHLHGRDMITTQEWTKDELDTIIDVALDLKRKRALGEPHALLRDKVLAMLFFFSSTRTRASFEAAGGTVRCAARVDRLLVRDGRVDGVRLTDGTEVRASTIVAACDPHRVFVDWLDEPPPAARKLVNRWKALPTSDGYESKIDGVIDALVLMSYLPATIPMR